MSVTKIVIMARIEGNCWKCGTRWEGDAQPGRGETCTQCGWDTRSCANCKHHDTRYHNECKIPGTDTIRERERSNFCEEFELKSKEGTSAQQQTSAEAKKKLDRLFGGG